MERYKSVLVRRWMLLLCPDSFFSFMAKIINYKNEIQNKVRKELPNYSRFDVIRKPILGIELGNFQIDSICERVRPIKIRQSQLR